MMKKRYIAIYAAICMLASSVFAGVTLNRNVLNVSAASEAQQIPFEVDFDGMDVDATPEGWAVYGTENEGEIGRTTMTVVTDDNDLENKVAKLSQTSARTGRYSIVYDFADTTQAVVLEYRYKAEPNSGPILLPVLTYGLEYGANAWPLVLKEYNGEVEYSNTLSEYAEAAALESNTWHTVQEIVDLENNVCELYLDGNKIELQEGKYNLDTNKTLSSIFFSIDKFGTGTAYIDDVAVKIYEKPQQIPFEVDFDGMDVDAIPEGWAVDGIEKDEEIGRTTMTVVTDVNDSENKVAKLSQTSARTGRYSILYDFADTTQAVVLEYRYKAEPNSGSIFLPVLTYGLEYGQNAWPLVLMESAGTIKYSNTLNAWVEAANLDSTTWHTVQEVVDLDNNVCELYLDGNKIELQEGKYNLDKTKTLSSIFFSIDKTNIGTAYIDDVSVKEYVKGEALTFENTQLTIPAYKAIALKPVFNPTNTSVQGVTYTSSDVSVAKVDANGVVIGIKEGTAVITADPSQPNLNNVEINVKVEGEAPAGINVVSDTLALPQGGHTFLEARLVLDGNVVVDDTLKYESANPKVATVDEWGEVLAVGAGTTTITIQSAWFPNIKKDVSVTVSEASVMRTIYVAPNGEGDGTRVETPTTLKGAADILAGINKENMDGNVEVILADGYYYQTETLKLNDAHGGNNLYSVVFKAAEGAQPVISGGIKISGNDFTKSAESEGVYEYDLSKLGLSDSIETRQMFVDNVRAIRARSQGTLTNAEFVSDTDGKMISIVCDNTELLQYERIEDLELVFYGNWVASRGQVNSIEQRSDNKVELIMDQPIFHELTKTGQGVVMGPGNIV